MGFGYLLQERGFRVIIEHVRRYRNGNCGGRKMCREGGDNQGMILRIRIRVGVCV